MDEQDLETATAEQLTDELYRLEELHGIDEQDPCSSRHMVELCRKSKIPMAELFRARIAALWLR